MSLEATYTSISEISQLVKLGENNMLGAICFVDHTANNELATSIAIPNLQLNAPILDVIDAACELWCLTSNKALTQANFGDISYRFNDDFLFGVITLPESIPLKNDTEIPSLQFITEFAYRQIFALMGKMNYPHIYRIWNYMPDINGVNPSISHGLERYRQFNVGRKEAFTACSNAMNIQLPAACALGTTDGPLSIAFLFGHQTPIAIENPRQISAYEYPDEYGPQTPSFSRATLLSDGASSAKDSAILFISGTASIVGHQTLHIKDVVAQTKETLANLEAVISEANRALGAVRFDLHNAFLRVYIRDALDLPLIKNEIRHHLGSAVKAVFVQADICRQALLLEIEATVHYNAKQPRANA